MNDNIEQWLILLNRQIIVTNHILFDIFIKMSDNKFFDDLEESKFILKELKRNQKAYRDFVND